MPVNHPFTRLLFASLAVLQVNIGKESDSFRRLSYKLSMDKITCYKNRASHTQRSGEKQPDVLVEIKNIQAF